MEERRTFNIFLIINFIVWTLVSFLRNTISVDSMEAITWGELFSFGTNKHPPLSGWLMGGAFHLTNGWCDVAYVLGQVCILVGFLYIYKLARCFFDRQKSICCAIVLEACQYYTFYIFVNSYNCNVLLMALWPAVIYYFYKLINKNNLKYALLFGITSGLATLGKYQIIFLFAAMFIYLVLFDRKQFKNKGIYLSIIFGGLIILPHILWLIKNDFFSFAYMIDRTQGQTHSLPMFVEKITHIFYPIKFIVDQILVVLPCVLIYLIMAWQSKNITINREKTLDKWFLLIVGVLPIVLQGLMGVVTGNRVPGMWGTIMVSMIGLLLFYYFPIKFNKNSFKTFVKLGYITMALSFIGVAIFGILQTKFYIAYPVNKIIPDLNKKWDEQTQNSELRYISGHMEYIFPLRYYNPRHPQVVLETFGHKNPWINLQDVVKSGLLVIGSSVEDLEERINDLSYLLPSNIQPKPELYEFEVCNKLNRCKTKDMYYSIILPAK